MTADARLVLQDCREALAALREEAAASLWRRQLVALLTLLRAVGHVLAKVDAPKNAELEAAVAQWWGNVNREKGAHPLFWEFVERERNSFIKQYETSARQVKVGYVGAVNFDAKTNTQWSDLHRPAIYEQRLVRGPFEGRQLLEVAGEAIEWWETQLSIIEGRAKGAA